MLTIPFRMSSSPTSHHHVSMPRKRSSAYAPSTRASDISRLMDPSYSSSSSAQSPHVYVDHSGDFHDPDYRDFPIVSMTRKPRWEQSWADRDEIDDDGEELLEDDRFARFSAYHTPASRRSTSRPRSPTSPTATTPSTYSPYSHFVTPSPPTSFDEEDEALNPASSPFGSDPELEKRNYFRRSIDSKRRKSDSSVRPPLPTNTPYQSSKEEASLVHEDDQQEWT